MQTTSRGFRIHYTVDGEGPPLMLVAQTLGAAQHWLDAGYVAALAPSWRVINVDPLGHGNSDTPHDPDAYEAAGVTEDLVAVLDAEGVDRATVWGYSRGGWLTCSLAAAHPERVDRIVVGGYAMHAHEEEVARLLAPLAGILRRSDWASLWQALGVSDIGFQKMIEDANDPLAGNGTLTWPHSGTLKWPHPVRPAADCSSLMKLERKAADRDGITSGDVRADKKRSRP